jgi:hypothetical protein
MKVTIKETPKTIFQNIPMGGTFIYDAVRFIKIKDDRGHSYAINLNTFVATEFAFSRTVIPVESELIMER